MFSVSYIFITFLPIFLKHLFSISSWTKTFVHRSLLLLENQEGTYNTISNKSLFPLMLLTVLFAFEQ